MPIRFRCAYCNQLMGISRRKAGKVVRCPKCAGEIIVPVPEGMDVPEDPAEQAGGPQAFEDPNFEQAFHAPPPVPQPTSATVPVDPNAPPPSAPAPMPPTPPPKRLGLFLPLGMLIGSLAVIVLLMILLFVVGLIIGRYTATPEKTAMTRDPNPRLALAPRPWTQNAHPDRPRER